MRLPNAAELLALLLSLLGTAGCPSAVPALMPAAIDQARINADVAGATAYAMALPADSPVPITSPAKTSGGTIKANAETKQPSRETIRGGAETNRGEPSAAAKDSPPAVAEKPHHEAADVRPTLLNREPAATRLPRCLVFTMGEACPHCVTLGKSLGQLTLKGYTNGRGDSNHFQLVYADGEGRQLFGRYGVRGCPTLVMLGTDGKEVARQVGASSADSLQAWYDRHAQAQPQPQPKPQPWLAPQPQQPQWLPPRRRR